MCSNALELCCRHKTAIRMAQAATPITLPRRLRQPRGARSVATAMWSMLWVGLRQAKSGVLREHAQCQHLLPVSRPAHAGQCCMAAAAAAACCDRLRSGAARWLWLMAERPSPRQRAFSLALVHTSIARPASGCSWEAWPTAQRLYPSRPSPHSPGRPGGSGASRGDAASAAQHGLRPCCPPAWRRTLAARTVHRT